MAAVIAVGIVRGTPVGAAVAFGVAAGSAAVMNSGLELCHRHDLERPYEQMKSASFPAQSVTA